MGKRVSPGDYSCPTRALPRQRVCWVPVILLGIHATQELSEDPVLSMQHEMWLLCALVTGSGRTLEQPDDVSRATSDHHTGRVFSDARTGATRMRYIVASRVRH
jgi:hypothetical protein